jgi:hypothetical protein
VLPKLQNVVVREKKIHYTKNKEEQSMSSGDYAVRHAWARARAAPFIYIFFFKLIKQTWEVRREKTNRVKLSHAAQSHRSLSPLSLDLRLRPPLPVSLAGDGGESPVNHRSLWPSLHPPHNCSPSLSLSLPIRFEVSTFSNSILCFCL